MHIIWVSPGLYFFYVVAFWIFRLWVYQVEPFDTVLIKSQLNSVIHYLSLTPRNMISYFRINRALLNSTCTVQCLPFAPTALIP